ncbi:hypothetical protein F511_43461 [Dorcoceras hygrometricum]|uniref:Uncharacterized protein n=1 Tax=Dorcoceras hygrometricum TaxID=472368 RepID=A0A2Z7C704_9LAMI|nr:hypothetical protein F511_43461 [Dorcoceras hygrometricum]
MSSPITSAVSSTAASIESASPRPEAGEPWLPEPEELPNTPWYEEKSSNLRTSDIPNIHEKGGMSDDFEVVIPGPEERAHRPPRGFHSFYINQLEMGLRFLLPRFITALCQHIKISPSQLAPNSYSFLLALAVLLSYHEIPLIPYVFMQLIQIKRLGPGKFYLSHKGDHSFIKGNPSSHKGWMSRFFFVRRVGEKTGSVRCTGGTMSSPFLPEPHPEPQTWPPSSRLCTFSRKGVEFAGDLDERMGKADMLKAMKEEARATGEVGPPKKTTKKRKVPSSAKEGVQAERRKKSVSTSGTRPEETQERSRAPTPPKATPEETPAPTQAVPTAEDSSSRRRSERPPLLILPRIPWYPPRRRLWLPALLGPYCPVRSTCQNFDKALRQHAEAVAKLEELEAYRAQELEEAKTQQELLEAELIAEKEARVAEKEAMRAELEEAKARSEQEAERLKGEAREEFLKSPEFDVLLGKRAFSYFKDGFWGCLAQFRANGYSEEEHPASFLDLQQALAKLGDEEATEEGVEEEQEEGEIESGAEDNPPNSPHP